MFKYLFLKPEKMPKREATAYISAEEAHDFVRDWEVAPGRELHIDLETTGLDWHYSDGGEIVSIAIASSTAIYYVDVRELGAGAWEHFLNKLSSCNLFAFNMCFDGGWLYHYCYKYGSNPDKMLEAFSGCTLTLFRALANEGYFGQTHSLEVAMETLLLWEDINKHWLKDALARHNLKKGEMWKLIDLEPAEFAKYNALDAEASFQLNAFFIKNLVRHGLMHRYQFHLNEEMVQIRELIEQQWVGIKIHQEKLLTYIEALKKKLVETEAAFRNHELTRDYITGWEQKAAEDFYKPHVSIKRVFAKHQDAPWECPEEWLIHPIAEGEGKKRAKWEQELGCRFYKEVIAEKPRNEGKPAPRFNMQSNAHMQGLIYGHLFNYTVNQSKRIVTMHLPNRDVDLFLTKEGGLPVGKEMYQVIGDVGNIISTYARTEKELGYAETLLAKSAKDGRVHPQFKPHGTMTGRLSASGGINCFHPSVELLTKRGWVGCLDITETDEVWQVNPISKQGSWSRPSAVIKQWHEGDLLCFGGARGELKVTPNHRMAWYGSSNQCGHKYLRTTPASEGIPVNREFILTSSFSAVGEIFPEDEIWMACALQADGSKLKDKANTYTVGVRKERKREKLEQLTGVAAKFYDMPCGQWQYRWNSIKFESPLLKADKTLDLSKVSTAQVDVVLEAIAFWDGHRRAVKGVHVEYSSTKEVNVDELMTYFSRAGYSVSKRFYNYGGNAHWRCVITNHIHLEFRMDKLRSEAYAGYVGCVSVPTEHILVRADGRCWVTGNCQQYPKIEECLGCFVADPGNEIVSCDAKALEPTIQAEFSQDAFLQELYLAPKPHDIYLFWAQYLHPDPEIRKALLRDYPKAWESDSMEELKKKYKAARNLIKVPVLSFSYGMAAKKLYAGWRRQGYKITFNDAVNTYETYWEKLATYKAWGDDLRNEVVARGGWMLNGFGFPMAIPEERMKDVPNTFVQSTGHAVLMVYNKHVVRLIKKYGVTTHKPVIQDFHDERICQVAKHETELMKHILKEAWQLTNEELQGSVGFSGEPAWGSSLWSVKGG